MNHEEYKELLALEALGALDANERETLSAHLATCAECAAELRESRDAAAMLAYTIAPVMPSANLRARVLEAVRVGAGGSTIGEPPREATRTNRSESDGAPTNVLPLVPKKPATEGFMARGKPFAFGAIAAGLVIAALVAALAVLWKRNGDARRELARATNTLRESQAEQSRLAERLSQTQTELAGARETGTPSATPAPSPSPDSAPPQTDTSADASRAANRNNELRAELARVAGRNNALQGDIAALSNRNNEVQAELARFSTRDSERQAEITRLTNLNRETRAQLDALSNRNRELQAEVTRLAGRNNELQTQVARFSTQASELQSEVARLTRRSSDLQNELARQREAEPIVTAPDSRVIALTGTGVAPGARGRLVYDRRGGNVIFNAYDLPPAPPGKAYQLWLIADGKPQSAGVFTTDEAGRAVLRGQVPAGGRRASAFAVTLEPAGGSSAPTGDKYLLGKAS
ncbi:MAG: anti-sigma factor domain-containing protein [Pyrinomonadaceae bacterium]